MTYILPSLYVLVGLLFGWFFRGREADFSARTWSKKNAYLRESRSEIMTALGDMTAKRDQLRKNLDFKQRSCADWQRKHADLRAAMQSVLDGPNPTTPF